MKERESVSGSIKDGASRRRRSSERRGGVSCLKVVKVRTHSRRDTEEVASVRVLAV